MHAHRCVGAFIWWAWGYGTAYHTADGDGNPFIGLPGKAHGSVGWVLKDESKSGADFVSWWFQCEPRPCLHSACTLSPMRSHNPTLLPLPQPFPPASRRVRRHRGHHRLWSDGRARAARCGPGRANPTLANRTLTLSLSLTPNRTLTTDRSLPPGAYVMYTTVITGLIYPVVVHWVRTAKRPLTSYKPAQKLRSDLTTIHNIPLYTRRTMQVWDSTGWASSYNPDAVLGGAIDFGGSGHTLCYPNPSPPVYPHPQAPLN